MPKAKPSKEPMLDTLDLLIEFSLRQERAALICVTSSTTSHDHGWAQGFAEGAKRLREQLERLRDNGSEIAL